MARLGKDEGMGHELRNLHDTIVAYLAGSTLRDRFTVGFNPETSRWVISLEKLSESEFNDIFNISSRLGLDPAQWDVGGNSEERHRTIRIAGLTSTQARDFARAVAHVFRVAPDFL